MNARCIEPEAYEVRELSLQAWHEATGQAIESGPNGGELGTLSDMQRLRRERQAQAIQCAEVASLRKTGCM